MQSAPVYDVVVIGSGAGGGTMVQVLTQLGVNVALLEAGPMLNPAKDYKEHKWPYDYDHRGALEGGSIRPTRKAVFFFSAPNGYWSIEDEPYTVAAGQQIPLVPLAHPRRPYEPLWPHHAAVRRLRFQALLDRRPGLRLAHHATMTSLPITTKPSASSASAEPRKASAPRPTASSSRRPLLACTKCWCRERANASASRHPGASRDHHQADQRPPALPLLRAVRTRLRDGVELFLQPGADLPRHEDRQAEDFPERDGARADHRRSGKGQRRFLCR